MRWGWREVCAANEQTPEDQAGEEPADVSPAGHATAGAE
jgi:hypothetical protein